MIERKSLERIAIALENLVRLGAVTSRHSCLVSYECVKCGRMDFGDSCVDRECSVCDRAEALETTLKARIEGLRVEPGRRPCQMRVAHCLSWNDALNEVLKEI